MPLPQPLAEQLGHILTEKLNDRVQVRDALPVAGGSINDAYRLHTNAGEFFVKTNPSARFPSPFNSEKRGLDVLRQAGVLRVPEVLAQGEFDGTAFLLMEFIAQKEGDRIFQARFGHALAQLHRHTQERFGLDHDNYIGLLPQVNTLHGDWVEFLVQCRLEPLVRLARDNGRIHPGDPIRFERLYARLPALIPPALPALLHGDLWKHNCLMAVSGEPVLIDPAVYYGHREMDVAMTRLFGGFEPDFYEAYNSADPLDEGWEERVDLCNLYPLLVHLNLFGGSYAGRIGAILRKHV